MSIDVDTVPKIWYEDLSSFITEKTATIFFPTREMSFEERLNASMRFALYFSVILYAIRGNAKILLLIPLAALATYVLATMNTKGILNVNEEFIVNRYRDGKIGSGENINTLSVKPEQKLPARSYMPTTENPMMNVLLSDYATNPNRPPALYSNNKMVSEKIDKIMAKKTYTDIDDVYLKKGGNRQFYTTANTTIPNYQTEFAHWLYRRDGPTFKEENL